MVPTAPKNPGFLPAVVSNSWPARAWITKRCKPSFVRHPPKLASGRSARPEGIALPERPLDRATAPSLPAGLWSCSSEEVQNRLVTRPCPGPGARLPTFRTVHLNGHPPRRLIPKDRVHPPTSPLAWHRLAATPVAPVRFSPIRAAPLATAPNLPEPTAERLIGRDKNPSTRQCVPRHVRPPPPRRQCPISAGIQFPVQNSTCRPQLLHRFSTCCRRSGDCAP